MCTGLAFLQTAMPEGCAREAVTWFMTRIAELRCDDNADLHCAANLSSAVDNHAFPAPFWKNPAPERAACDTWWARGQLDVEHKYFDMGVGVVSGNLASLPYPSLDES